MKTVEAEVMDAPSTDVAKTNPQSVAPRANAMQQIIDQADKLDPAKLKMLMDLQERYDAIEARKAFDEALAQAKAEIPVIIKNRKVGFASKSGGARTDYRHEDLGEIARTIDPVLGKYGLSYRFRTTSVPNEPIVVTCIVSHRLGHSEENTLSAGRDDSGNKNSIQQIGSTITYLQRYTLKAALGLAASNDDDGAKADAPPDGPISEKQIEQIQMLIVKTNSDIGRFCKAFGVNSIPDILASQFNLVVNRLKEKAAKEGVEV